MLHCIDNNSVMFARYNPLIQGIKWINIAIDNGYYGKNARNIAYKRFIETGLHPEFAYEFSMY